VIKGEKAPSLWGFFFKNLILYLFIRGVNKNRLTLYYTNNQGKKQLFLDKNNQLAAIVYHLFLPCQNCFVLIILYYKIKEILAF
jgi:deoxycytidylate deaminase